MLDGPALLHPEAAMLSLRDIQTRIRAGALTPEAALDLSRKAVSDCEGDIGAFVYLDGAARASGHGPLNGIAVGVKDIIDTADMPTECGSPIYAGWRPRADAAVVAQLKRAGATILGKTTTTPFAFLDPTATRNPANTGHTPGGSSAGSAAAVAAGMVPLALGTQTGGSIIRPASFCGVAALKPSFRLIPTVGVKTYAWTLDTLGLFAATVADLAIGLEAVTGRTARGLEGRVPVFGLLRQSFAGAAEPAAVAALDRAVAALRAAGASISEVAPPQSLAEAWSAHPIVQGFEARAALAWEYDHHRDQLPPKLGAELDRAQDVTAAAYDDARRLARRARQDTRGLFAACDAILTYAAPGAAPHGLDSTGDARFNRLFTMLGTPCVNVPGLTDEAGLPIGIQVVAPFARDGVALEAGTFIERALAMAEAKV
jgi:Asp-tRNA(Asn)/Glu-tRNA(Gln) amidotransferase A subunit family amidase